MKMTEKPNSSRSCEISLEDLALHEHVERGGRLVHDHHLRLEGERHRDHDALAHAAGELVRVGAAAGRGRPRRGRAGRRSACALGAATSRAGGCGRRRRAARRSLITGLSEFIAPWNTIETLSQRNRRSASAVERVDVDVFADRVVEDDAAAGDDGRRLEQALDAVGERRLAAAGLAGEAEDLAAVEVERDVLDRRDGRIDVVDDAEVARWRAGGLS